MTRIQTAARTAAAIGAAGVAVLGFAPTFASAAAGDSVTVAGSNTYTYTTNQSPDIEAVAQPNCGSSSSKVTLAISGPGVLNSTLVSRKPDCKTPLDMTPSAASVNTSDPAWSGGTAAMNGTYTLTLDNEGSDTVAHFTLLIPPAKTTGFRVTASKANAIFHWTANSEPDITSYVIKNAGHVVAQPSSACSGTACGDTVNLGSAVAGHTEKFSIVAVRACGNAQCSGGSVPGKTPAVATAKFATASGPSSSPTPSPTSSGGSGKGNGGAGSLSDPGGKSGKRSSTGTLSDPGGKTLLHKRRGVGGGLGGGLPAISGGSLPSLVEPNLPSDVQTSTEPQGLGKPGGNLKYPAPEIATKKKVSASGGGFTHDISVAVNERPLWRGIAAAAVLLLIAVHLRTWAGRTDYM